MKRLLGHLAAALACLACPVVHAGPVFFEVAEQPGSEFHLDSYVLPLTRLEDIAHARDLIAFGPQIGAPLAVAHIAAGPDGSNRNLRSAGAPLWSWHVDEFIGFADVTAEVLDGWPGLVEQDVEGWIANTRGFIGFWLYTPVAELSGQGGPAGVAGPGTLALLLFGLPLLRLPGRSLRFT